MGARSGYVNPAPGHRHRRHRSTVHRYEAANARNVFALATPSNGVGAQIRDTGFAVTSHDNAPLTTATFTDPFIQ